MKQIILKLLLALFVAFLFCVPALIFWMRAGEEEPLDYSAMDFELGPQDSEINGYTYLREFSEENEADIPDNYPYDFERDIDYSLYENWDLEFFEEILEANEEFLKAIESSFNRPMFMADQEFSPETMFFHVGPLRSARMLI